MNLLGKNQISEILTLILVVLQLEIFQLHDHTANFSSNLHKVFMDALCKEKLNFIHCSLQDSYLILDTLPCEYDSRVKAMEVDTRPTEQYSDIGGLDKQIQELIEAVVLPMTHKER